MLRFCLVRAYSDCSQVSVGKEEAVLAERSPEYLLSVKSRWRTYEHASEDDDNNKEDREGDEEDDENDDRDELERRKGEECPAMSFINVVVSN